MGALNLPKFYVEQKMTLWLTKICYNRVSFSNIIQNCIRFFHCALPLTEFPYDFSSDPSNHQLMGQWNAGLNNSITLHLR